MQVLLAASQVALPAVEIQAAQKGGIVVRPGRGPPFPRTGTDAGSTARVPHPRTRRPICASWPAGDEPQEGPDVEERGYEDHPEELREVANGLLRSGDRIEQAVHPPDQQEQETEAIGGENHGSTLRRRARSARRPASS